MSDPPVLVDAARPAVLTDDGATVLLPTTAAGTWCFAEVTIPTARTAGRPILTVLRDRSPVGGDAAVTVGGTLLAQLDLLAPVPAADQITAWSAQLLRLGATPLADDRFRFLPLRLRQGRMELSAADGVLADPQPLDIGSATSVVVTAALRSAGADAVTAAVASGMGPPVGVDVDLTYDLAIPECRYRVVADPAAVHAVLATDPDALAPFLGQPGGPAAAAALLAALPGAVSVMWAVRPAAVPAAAMEAAILQRWLGPAAAALGARVVPGTQPAVVTLPPLGNPPDLDVTHDGGRAQTVVLRRGADLARLRGLGPGFVADVALDAASLPLAVAFPPDERVQQYACHIRFRTADGSDTVTAHEARGNEGLVINELVRWPLGSARPALVTVQYSVTWTAADWPTATDVVELATDRPTLNLTVQPGAHLAEVAIVADLATAAVGSLASISWVAERPNGGGSTAGSIVVEGAGPHGGTALYTVTFPRAASGSPIHFRWTIELIEPDGVRLVGNGSLPVTDAAELAITVAELAPG
jgi:hypothetical protein